jgi:4'-phosphopantetheinyl transferase
MTAPPTPRRPAATAKVAVAMACGHDLPAGQMLGLMSGPERRRAERIAHYQSWLQFVRTRGLLRLVLAHCTGRPAQSFAIADDGGAGAPFLIGAPPQVHFSVSHSGEWSAVAVGDRPLGIDIERLHMPREWQAVAEACFHPRERDYLLGAGPDARPETFFAVWTRKEACLKAAGTGFAQDPSSFSTVPLDAPAVTAGADALRQQWRALALSAPAGYAAALASTAESVAISYLAAAAVRRGAEGARRPPRRWRRAAIRPLSIQVSRPRLLLRSSGGRA